MADAGDLEELVRLHYQGLLRLAYVLCGDPAEAEDIVGDVLVRAWPRLSRGKVDEPATYLRRAVVNRVASWRRHRFVVRREELRRRPEPPAQTLRGKPRSAIGSGQPCGRCRSPSARWSSCGTWRTSPKPRQQRPLGWRQAPSSPAPRVPSRPCAEPSTRT